MKDIEKRIIELCIDYKKDKSNFSYKRISDIIKLEYGVEISQENVRAISRRFRKRNNLDSSFKSLNNIMDETYSINQNGTTTSEKVISVKKDVLLTKDILLKEHGFDSNEFELVSAKTSKWNGQAKDSKIIDMYSSKITVKPVKDFVWSQEAIDKIFKELKIPKNKKQYNKPIAKNGRCLIVPISDLHLGLLAEKNICGNDYNIEIAEKLYYYVLNDILSEVKTMSFEKVIFIIGNDFINSDNINNTTTKGTPQDSTNLWHTIVDKAIEMCINGIDMLADVGPVDVIYAVSNHDYHTVYGVMNTLKAYYKDSNRVTIYGSPSERKYVKFGKVIIGIAHDIKQDKALEIMSVEAHDMWSDAKSMIWFLGHLHTQMAYSKKGYVEIFRLPTVSGTSRWANQQGYSQTERKNQCFIIDSEIGIKNTINTVIKL